MALLVTPGRATQHPACSALGAALLTSLLTAASDWVERRCHRTFASTAHLEKHDGDGDVVLWANQLPIITLTSVIILDDDGSTTTTVDGADFRYNAASGEIRFAPTVTGDWSYFPSGFQNITLSYTAGFATIPELIQEAVIALTLVMVAKGAHEGNPAYKSESLGAYSYTLTEAAAGAAMQLPPELLRDIDTYIIHGRAA